jgi:hypothetical protein
VSSTYPTITGIGASGGGLRITQNAWVSICGVDLVPASLGLGDLTWSDAPSLTSLQMPTALGGVTATVNRKPAARTAGNTAAKEY